MIRDLTHDWDEIAPREAPARIEQLDSARHNRKEANKRGLKRGRPAATRQRLPKKVVDRHLVEKFVVKENSREFPKVWATLCTQRRLEKKAIRDMENKRYERGPYCCGRCGRRIPHTCQFIEIDADEARRLHEIFNIRELGCDNDAMDVQILNAEEDKADTPKPPKKKQKKGKGGQNKNNKNKNNKGRKKDDPPQEKSDSPPRSVRRKYEVLMSPDEVAEHLDPFDDATARERAESPALFDSPLSSVRVDIRDEKTGVKLSKFREFLAELQDQMADMFDDLSMVAQYIDFFENIGILCRNLYRSTDIGDLVMALIVHIKLHTRKPITTQFLSLVDSVFFENDAEPSDDWSWVNEAIEEQELNSENFMTKWDLFCKHPMYDKIIYLIGVAIGMTSCDKTEVVWSWSNLTLIKIPVITSAQGAFDVIDAIIRVTTWMLQTGVACLQQGSLTPILYGDHMTRKMNDAYVQVMGYRNQLLKQQFDAGTALVFTRTTILSYKRYREKLGDKLTTTLVDKRIADMEEIDVTLDNRLVASSTKPCGMAVIFQGASGIGKSFFSEMVVKPYFASTGVKYDPTMTAQVNPAEDHDNSAGNHIKHYNIDDVSNPKIEWQKEAITEKFLHYMNVVPWRANMADLPQKGKVWIRCDLLTSTCNPELVNVSAYTDHPESFFNRIVYVEAKVRPEYRAEGNLALAKYRQDVVSVGFWDQDFWDFTIKKPIVTEGDGKKKVGMIVASEYLPDGSKIYCEGLSAKVFRRVWACMCLKHANAQGHAMKRKAEISNMEVCFKCCNVQVECLCHLYDESVSNLPHLEHFYTKKNAAVAYPELERLVEEEDAESDDEDDDGDSISFVTSFKKWWGSSQSSDSSDQRMNSISDVLWEGCKQGLYEACTAPFTTFFWYDKVLCISPVKNMATKKVAKEFRKYLNNVTVPWLIGAVPDAVAETRTYKYIMNEMAAGAAWCDTKKLFRNLGFVQLVGLGLAGYTFGYTRRSLVPSGLVLMGANLSIGSTFHYYRHKHIVEQWSQRPDSLIVNNAILRHEQYKGMAGVVVPAFLLGIKLFSMWNSQQVNHGVAEFFSTDVPNKPVQHPPPSDTFNIGDQTECVGTWNSFVTGIPSGNTTNSDTRTMTAHQMIQSLKKSGVHMIKVGNQRTNAVFLETGVAVVPRHLFYHKPTFAFFQNTGSVFGARATAQPCSWISNVFEATIDINGASCSTILRLGSNLFCVPDQDLALIYLSKCPTMPRRVHWLPKEKPIGTYVGFYVTARDGGASGATSVTMGEITDHPFIASYWGGMYDSKLDRGDCAAPVIADKGGPYIACFHITSSRSGDESRGASLTRGVYDTLRSQFENRNSSIILSGVDDQEVNSVMGLPLVVGPVHPKAYTPAGVIPLGATKVRRQQKTSVKRTQMYAAAVEHFGPDHYKGPEMKPNWKHFNASLEQISNPIDDIDIAVLNRACDDYVGPLLEDIQDKGLRARPLTELETVCGKPGVKFIDAMNHSTSGGVNAPGRKDQHYEITYEDGKAVAVKFDAQLRSEVDKVETDLREGRRPNMVYSSCLKDEVVEADKESVRVFQIMGVAGSVTVRKYFLPIVAYLQTHPLETEIAVGLDASSPQWEKLYSHVMQHGEDHILGFDYSKYDKKISAQLMGAAVRILIRIAAALGYGEEDLEIMRRMAIEFTNPRVDWNGTLFEFLNSNPSGNNLTVILNSIINALLVRCAFFQLWHAKRSEPLPSFREYVAAVFYGDDALMTTKWTQFDCLYFRDWMMQLGMKITPPHKDAKFTKFLSLDLADFLKRTNYAHPDLGVCVGPLARDSILKPFYYRVPGCATPGEHAAGVIASALSEAFLHGREFFEEIQGKVRRVALDSDVSSPALAIDYEERIRRWKARFD